MPARDRCHQRVRTALVKDGWTITHDPLALKWGGKDLYVDLGAEHLVAAEKGPCRIAVEIRGFLGPSEIDDLEKALGQYVLYHDVLLQVEPDRQLYLAVNEEVFVELFEEPIGRLLVENGRLRLIVFDEEKEEIRRWTPQPPTAN
jgi:hypothetical protein